MYRVIQAKPRCHTPQQVRLSQGSGSAAPNQGKVVERHGERILLKRQPEAVRANVGDFGLKNAGAAPLSLPQPHAESVPGHLQSSSLRPSAPSARLCGRCLSMGMHRIPRGSGQAKPDLVAPHEPGRPRRVVARQHRLARPCLSLGSQRSLQASEVLVLVRLRPETRVADHRHP